jgi:hypothetical protein
MNEEELRPLLALYGLLPESTRAVGRPPMNKQNRAAIAKIKKQYRAELETAKIMRTDALNITRGVDRPLIVKQMLDDGHTEPAMLLTFNNEQLALLMAWRDAASKPGSSSKENVE